MRDKRERKRRRVNPPHRWTDTQTKILLAAILDEVQDNGAEMFEKPTAMRFYDKVTRNVNEINGIANWSVCKSKMRYLKQTYLQALAWNKQIGAGLVAEGNTRAVAEYMKRYCPFWDLLDKIFGQTVTGMKQEGLSGDGKDGDPLLVVLREEHDADEQYEDDEEDEEEEQEDDEAENSETDLTFSENDFNTFKNQFKQKPATPARPAPAKTTNKSTSSTTTFSANSGSIAVLVSMQEKKLQFEETKWRQQQEYEVQKLELEREKCKLMKLELKQRQELKRLEIERDERLALAKMQLETESDERIKKYELELKIKSNLY